MTTEAKKGAVRGPKVDPRGAGLRSADRPSASKRPSTPPPSQETLIAKKRERASEVETEEDQDDDELAFEAPKSASAKPVGAGNGAVHSGAHGPHGSGSASSGPRRGLPTGSLHTMARQPAQAENLKQRLTALMTAQQRLAELKRSANKHFYEVGEVLRRIRDDRLFEVKGYSSLDAFIEREVQLGAQFCRDVVRVHELFQPEAAQMLGMSRLSAALRALDDEPSGVTAIDQIPGARPAIPPHKL